MRKLLISLVILAALLIPALSNTAEAASDHYVSKSGTNNSSCSQLNPCRTIEHTLNVAHSGDTVHVGGGNYYESVTINEDVNIEGNPTCTPCTIWYSAGNTQVMVINNSATVSVQNFNIRGGGGDNGGAIIAGSGTNVTLTNLYIYDNEADWGGAIYNRGNMIIDDVLINDNTAETRGGAIYNEGTLDIQSSRIFDNYAHTTGGAIYNVGSLEFHNASLFSNKAFYSGGAIYNKGQIQFQSGNIIDNKAEHGVGGAIYNNDGGRVVVVDSEVSKNVATSPCQYFGGNRDCTGGTPSGGAVYNGSEGDLVLTFVEMYANRVNAADEWDGKGGAVANLGKIIIAFSTLKENSVDTEDYNPPYNQGSSSGGAFFNGGQAEVYNSTFNDNEVDSNGASTYGGGIYNDREGELTIENSTITQNIVGGLGRQYGGGIYNAGQIESHHLTISHNLAGELEEPNQSAGSGIYNSSRFDITNSIVAMNYGADCMNIQPLNGHGENLDSDGTCNGFSQQGKDPLLGALKNNGGPTFTRLIAWSSPALDSADLNLCHAGDQRSYNRPFGGGCDLGAIELSRQDD